jgi:ABC-2 type transport system ATP-binding protein
MLVQAVELTKRYGRKLAVDGLSFDVRPGEVTGFLGSNGAGKSTTMRLMLGLDRPDAGHATFDGRPYVGLERPARRVGVLIDANAVHPKRSARTHLRITATSNAIPQQRVDEVLEMVDLASVAHKHVGTFSLGMHQRLGIARALLGDPELVILDEPNNGLDPPGVIWVRETLKRLAAEGRSVLVSSHQLAEMSLTADRVVVISHGRLIADSSVQEFVEHSSKSRVRVRSPQLQELGRLLTGLGARTEPEDAGALAVYGAQAEAIGELAAKHGIVLHELAPVGATLEEAFLEATADASGATS